MMTPSEEAQFRNAGREMSGGTVLRWLATPDGRCAPMGDFCERVAALLPQISIAREEGTASDDPWILLPNGVRYQGVPQGNELPPFIQALAGKTPPLSDRLRARWDAAPHTPAELDLFVTPQCTFCPGAVRGLMPLATASRLVRLTIIDAAFFPERAQHRGVQAVPTLILDGQFRWTGAIALEEVIDLLATRDPVSMGPVALEMMLKDGAARRVAAMMVDRNKFFPALIELLSHEQWPVRLGAMVAVEELYSMAPDLSRQAIDAIWHRFDVAPDPVKGDILFLCGEIGWPELVPRIKAVLQSGAAVEVKAAAEEALEKLQ